MGALEIAYQGPTLAVEAESVRHRLCGRHRCDRYPSRRGRLQRRATAASARASRCAQRPNSSHRRAFGQRGRSISLSKAALTSPRCWAASRPLHVPVIGGLEGRALRAGDILPLKQERTDDASRNACCRRSIWRHPDTSASFSGPRTTTSATKVNGRSSRAPTPSRRPPTAWACDSRGPRSRTRKGYNIVSDGIAPGSIQVPGNGLPIVLLADRQTTGGYPKIATVISADMPALGRLMPGAKVAFKAVDIAAAEAAHRQLRADIDAIAESIVQRAGGDRRSQIAGVRTWSAAWSMRTTGSPTTPND